jgi:hypothetical protein
MSIDLRLTHQIGLVSDLLRRNGQINATEAQIFGSAVNASIKIYDAWMASRSGDAQAVKTNLLEAVLSGASAILQASAAVNRSQGNATPGWIPVLGDWLPLPQPVQMIDLDQSGLGGGGPTS